jgi:AcrR family transcriptional regulator
MARTINESDHLLKRDTILDSIAKLMYSKGYEQMTIKDILDDLQISKGAFYHYFNSKQDAFSALLERMGNMMDSHLLPIVQDKDLNAGEKLQKVFTTITGWKSENKDMLLSITRVWYSDENIVIRNRLRSMRVNQLSPMFTSIVYQGIEEGLFKTYKLLKLGEVVVNLILDLNDSIAHDLINPEKKSFKNNKLLLMDTIDAYSLSLTRILGASEEAFELVNKSLIDEWI